MVWGLILKVYLLLRFQVRFHTRSPFTNYTKFAKAEEREDSENKDCSFRECLFGLGNTLSAFAELDSLEGGKCGSSCIWNDFIPPDQCLECFSPRFLHHKQESEGWLSVLFFLFYWSHFRPDLLILLNYKLISFETALR